MFVLFRAIHLSRLAMAQVVRQVGRKTDLAWQHHRDGACLPAVRAVGPGVSTPDSSRLDRGTGKHHDQSVCQWYQL